MLIVLFDSVGDGIHLGVGMVHSLALLLLFIPAPRGRPALLPWLLYLQRFCWRLYSSRSRGEFGI